MGKKAMSITMTRRDLRRRRKRLTGGKSRTRAMKNKRLSKRLKKAETLNSTKSNKKL